MRIGEFVGPTLVICAIVGALIWELYAPSPPTVANQTLIPAHIVPHILRTKDEGDDELTLVDHASGRSYGITRRLRSYYQSDTQAQLTASDGKPAVEITVTSHRYLIDPGLDYGVTAAFVPGFRHNPDPKAGGPFQTYLRISPVRFGYGLASFDGLLGSESLGVGVSCYPLAQLLENPALEQCGVTVGRVWSYRGGTGSWAFGACLSTRF